MKPLLTLRKAHTTDLTQAARSRGTADFLGRFWATQDGAMTYMGVAGALVMMVFGGIGIDMIHAELKRTEVQNTLDRAVLAAANMNNGADPGETVQSYFDAMGMGDALGTVTVAQTDIAKTVAADAEIVMPANFMELIGVENLRAAGDAAAQHGLLNIEISMVLDVSGSMSGAKIEQLRQAARSFVDLMLPEEGNALPVTISIVPYNATVNLGPDVAGYYNLDDTQTYSHCATFETADFVATGIPDGQMLTRLGHFDPYSRNVYDPLDVTQPVEAIARPWCQTDQTSAIIPHSDDADALKAHIDTFTAGGNTAIDLGMKWGAALLDPSARPTVADMALDGVASIEAADRPAPYGDIETLKFVVIMTDGQNTTQYDLRESFKTGGSGIFVDSAYDSAPTISDYGFQILDAAGQPTGDYLRPVDVARAENGETVTPWTPAGPLRELSNTELYALFSTRDAWTLFYRPAYEAGHISYSEYYNRYYTYVSTVNYVQADTNLSIQCGAARDQGVVIYAIGVEAPARGQTAMRDCASSASHYFDVQGEDLTRTFESIARSLTQLRLTQ
ncbi:TadE/TadG family type IV pilus assembly protein [Cognatishimia sp. F0-27]|uniref:TadE/TadG family type IV pilus assembly protein n=1 Tax=Cognatishimia sp. F0-27 TaxID=2816855 RepID=UPI001D0C70D4|nr:TadE/TadG family type IV pilus assembly protein [Cognatishimia sp. F0-27]MCC1491713.1 pilus assembly protein [Cognatishimia sp. F0-27]